MTRNTILRVAHAALWLAVTAYAAVVVRHFFHQAASAIYVSTDDGMANVSYALATTGRYGFLSSPLLQGMAREHGLFSYGPFYFYVGAGLIWLFGYSLTLLRSIHLAVILAIAAAGRAWFGRAAAGAAAAIMAVGLLEAFDRAQWPMVRPDSLVSLLAIALVITAGLAMRTGHARYWFAAGVAAACGALTHLIAWSLIPAVLVILALDSVAAAVDDRGRWRVPPIPWAAVAATGLGGLAGAVLFYASFGFRFADQIAFLRDYQHLTGSMGGGHESSGRFTSVILQHFKAAYWYLPWPLDKAVWITLSAGVVFVVMMLYGARSRRRDALAMVGPPIVVWVGYLASLGVYNNFHAGYAILNQVMWLWTLAALATVLLAGLDRWPGVRRTVEVLAWTLAFGLAVGVPAFFAQRTDYRLLANASYVPIDQYVDRVLEPLPARARSWGDLMFGIEHPGRVQLVQFDDALRVVGGVSPSQRLPLAPDDLIWGSGNNTNDSAAVLAGGPGIARRAADLFPGIHYALVSMTDAPPYGVTRVLARTDAGPRFDPPIVSLYDSALRQWNSALGAPSPIRVSAADPLRVQVGTAPGSPLRTAAQTLTGELPSGIFLLRISLASEVSAGASLSIAATSSTRVRDPFGQFGPDFDIGPSFGGERCIYVIHRHRGGPFFVSRFGSANVPMTAVDAWPILSVPDYSAVRRGRVAETPIPANQWTAANADVQVLAADGGVAVIGNGTQFGYQAYGPSIPVRPGQRMTLSLQATVTAGTGCFGVLDEIGSRWVVAPDRLAARYEFTIGDSHAVRPVFADCRDSAAASPLRATLGPGGYAVWSPEPELYVDVLMRAWRAATPR